MANKDKDKMADAKAVDSLLPHDAVPSKAETDAKAAKLLDEVGADGRSLAVKLNEISEKTRTGHGLEREDFDALDVAKTVFDADERRQANAVVNANKVVDAVTAVMSNRDVFDRPAETDADEDEGEETEVKMHGKDAEKVQKLADLHTLADTFKGKSGKADSRTQIGIIEDNEMGRRKFIVTEHKDGRVSHTLEQ